MYTLKVKKGDGSFYLEDRTFRSFEEAYESFEEINFDDYRNTWENKDYKPNWIDDLDKMCIGVTIVNKYDEYLLDVTIYNSGFKYFNINPYPNL